MRKMYLQPQSVIVNLNLSSSIAESDFKINSKEGGDGLSKRGVFDEELMDSGN